jgi:hypothetical protein
MSGQIIPPQPLDVIQWVTIRLHADGTVSTAGTIADKKMALRLIDIARDAVKNQVQDYKAIIVPNHDVGEDPKLPVKDLGYLLEAERGDP